MAPETTRFGLIKGEKHDLEWHLFLNDNFDEIDARMIDVDAGANRQSTPPGANVVFIENDGDNDIYQSNAAGDGWNRIGSVTDAHPVSDLDSENATAGFVPTVQSDGSFGYEPGRGIVSAHDTLVYDDGGTITAINRDGTLIDTGDAQTNADCRRVLQAAIDTAPAKGEIYFAGDYEIDSTPLSVYDGKVIRGTVTIQQSNAGEDIFHCQGQIGNYQDLTADATQGDGQLSVTDASVFSEGDLIEVSKQVAWSPNESADTGEIERVESADTTNDVLYIDGPLIEGYPTADTARVRPITPVTGEIHDLNLIGPGGDGLSGGIDVLHGHEFWISGVDIEHCDNFGVRFDGSYNCSVSDFQIRHAQRSTSGGSTGYGVWLSGGSTMCEIRDGTILSCRHATAVTGTNGAQGKGLEIVNVDARQPEESTVANHLFDSHPKCHELSFRGCTGELVADYDTVFVTGCRKTEIRNCRGRGKGQDNNTTTFFNHRDDTENRELVIEGCTMEGLRGAIFRGGSGAGNSEHIRVANNTAVNGYELFDINPDYIAETVEVVGNLVRNAIEPVIEAEGRTGDVYKNNTVVGGSDYGFEIDDSTDLTVVGNVFRNLGNDGGIFLNDIGSTGTEVSDSYIARNVIIADGSNTNTRIIFEISGSGNRYVDNEGTYSLDQSDPPAGALFESDTEPTDWRDGDIWFQPHQ